MNRLVSASVLAALMVGLTVPVAWGGVMASQAVVGTDPNLVGSWQFDDLEYGRATDSSGWARHGMLYGSPSWVEGRFEGALQVDGIDDYVDTHYAEDLPRWTVSAWVNSPRAPQATQESGPVHRGGNYQLHWDDYDGEFRGAAALRIGNTWYAASFGQLPTGRWCHLAATFDGTALRAYLDGELVAVNTEARGVPHAEPATLKIGRHTAGPWFFLGTIDDVRVYNRALADTEIKGLTERDPLVASNPQPPYGGNLALRDLNVSTLTWSPGRTAVVHDIYFSNDARLTEAPYTGWRQANTSVPLAPLVWSVGRYYWRVDEVEADGKTIHKGPIWTFTVTAHNMIDDFESYTEVEGHRIEQTWIDGRVNNTGSRVSLASNISAGQAVGARGRQSMLLTYDNTRSPFFSEIEREFVPAQDWTADLMTTLRLSLNREETTFEETSEGTYVMTAAGSGILNNRDGFRYAFKPLDGDGSMVVEVRSVSSTPWSAQAGVMIRESLSPGSAHAFMFVTPEAGRVFQNRPANDASISPAASSPSHALTLPYWVKIERQGNQFTGYYSADGVNWIRQPEDEVVTSYRSPNPQTINMPSTVYIGLALTSRHPGIAIRATFSGVQITGNVTGPWQVADIGIEEPDYNRDRLYLAIEDSNGRITGLDLPDYLGVNAMTWTEWRIPLSYLARVDLRRVKRMFISVDWHLGVGGETTSPPGTGRIHIDDIRVER